MKNRFNHTLKKGMHVSVQHPRGGTYEATITGFDTVRSPDAATREFVRAYGPRAVFAGGSASVDDCTPISKS